MSDAVDMSMKAHIKIQWLVFKVPHIFHRIIKSQSWKRPQGPLSPTPYHAGTPSKHSRQMAILPLLKNLQRRRLHHTLRQHNPLLTSSDCQEVLPEIQVESLFLYCSLKALLLVLVAGVVENKPVPSSPRHPFKHLNMAIMSPSLTFFL